jgi:hypothetical protein
MKKIMLYSGALDAALQFVDAGNVLAIGDSGEPGTIGAEAAAELVERGAAVDAEALGDPDGLDKQTVAELQAIASREGAEATGNRKQDLIDAIRARRAVPPPVAAPGSGLLPGESSLPIVRIKDPDAEGGELLISARGIVPAEAVEVESVPAPLDTAPATGTVEA